MMHMPDRCFAHQLYYEWFAHLQPRSSPEEQEVVFLVPVSTSMKTRQTAFTGKLSFILLLVVVSSAYAQQSHIERYKDGTLKAEGLIINEKKNGEWKYFFPNGVLMSVETFKDDLLNGKIRYYFPSGKLQGIETWINGNLHDSATYFHENGNIEKKGKYTANQYEGEWRHFYSNGKPE